MPLLMSAEIDELPQHGHEAAICELVCWACARVVNQGMASLMRRLIEERIDHRKCVRARSHVENCEYCQRANRMATPEKRKAR